MKTIRVRDTRWVIKWCGWCGDRHRLIGAACEAHRDVERAYWRRFA